MRFSDFWKTPSPQVLPAVVLFAWAVLGAAETPVKTEPPFRYVVHLDVSNAVARDRETDGRGEVPFRTLEKAVDWAHDLWNTEDGDVLLLIHPGRYRGTIRIRNAHRSPRFVIAAEKAGTVLISQAEEIGGWKPGADGLWTAPWSNRAAVEIISNQGAAGSVFTAASEVVAAGGVLWKPGDAAELRPGQYRIEGGAYDKPGKITARPPEGWAPSTPVAAAVRPEDSPDPSRNVVRLENTGRITLRGLQFEMIRGRLPAVSVRKCRDVTLEQCGIRHVSREGISVSSSDGVTLRGLRIDQSGWAAINLRDSRNVLVEDFFFSGGLWRDAPESFRRNVLLSATSNVTFRWGLTAGNAGAPLRLEGRNRQARFDQVIWDDTERGPEIAAGGSKVEFTNCAFAAPKTAGFTAPGGIVTTSGWSNADEPEAKAVRRQLEARWANP